MNVQKKNISPSFIPLSLTHILKSMRFQTEKKFFISNVFIWIMYTLCEGDGVLLPLKMDVFDKGGIREW